MNFCVSRFIQMIQIKQLLLIHKLYCFCEKYKQKILSMSIFITC